MTPHPTVIPMTPTPAFAHFVHQPLALAARLALIAPLTVFAQAAQPVAQATLPKLTVTANRIESKEDDVPATVTSTTRSQLDRRAIGSTVDLFADEPDVAMGRDVRRFGGTRPNVRGLEDNRVVQLVDGVRLTDYYNGGGPTNFTMTAPLGVVPDFLKRVEVVRGASSSLYGSDAMAGVVGYLTLEPTDLLRVGESRAARVRVGWFGANAERRLTTLGAYRHNGAELLVGLSVARAEETDNQGDVDTVSATRTRPNPQSIDDSGVLAKWVQRPNAHQRWTLALEGRELSVATEVERLSTALPRVTRMVGDDHARRVRASLDWEHKPGSGAYDRLTARLHHQDARTRNDNHQRRSNTSASCSAAAGGANQCDIDQTFSFAQRTTGAALQIDKIVDAGGAPHAIVSGLDTSRQQTQDLRDATVHNLTTGTTGKTLAGDQFPLRDFANGRTDTIGLYVQDTISGLAGGPLSLTPGLRYDWRKLSPQVDALAQSVLAAIGRQAVEKSDGAWAPKLAAQWRFSPQWMAYGQVARSYRAPNYNEVNGAFRNTAQSYGITPNPDLEPETGVGAELGLKMQRGSSRAQVAVYDNRYKNFIDSVYLACPGDPRCIAGIMRTLTSENLSRVRIQGAELRGDWEAAPGWRVDGALAYARGTHQDTGAPLNSIEPARATLGIVRDAGHWGAQARLRAAARKDRVDDSDGVWFRPPGYAVVDLSAWMKIGRHLNLTATVSNLFDRSYWLWSDIRHADATQPAGVDFYSQPGRKLSLAVQADF